MLWVSGCQIGDRQSNNGHHSKYTILVYMNGSDLESEAEMASGDLFEMMSAQYDREEISVVVQTGGTLTWSSDSIPDDKIGRFLVGDGYLIPIDTLPLVSMGDSTTLTDFIDFGMQHYPAEKYGLILWNHGGGSVIGYGVDEHFDGDGLSLGELHSAFDSSGMKHRPFEFIGFDACLMATLETAAVASDYAGYLIGSQELEPGYGWDYESWLGMLGDDPAMDGAQLGENIARSFVDFYQNNEMEDEPVTLSVVDLKKVPKAIEALEKFITLANADLIRGDYNKLASPRSRTFEFGMPTEYGGSVDMIDIVDLARQFQSIYPEQSAALKKGIEDAVSFKAQGGRVSAAGGLSLYFPYSGKESADSLALYKQTGFSQAYIDYVSAFVKTMAGDALAPFSIWELAPEQNDMELTIRLSKEEVENLAEIYLTAWIHIDEQHYIQIYRDSQVEINEDSVITTEFDGTFTTIGGELACLEEIDSGDDYIIYAAAGLLNGKKVNFIVLYDESAPEGKVIGALPVYDDGSHMPARQMLSVKSGDRVAFSYYMARFVDPDDDSDEMEDDELWFDGDEFTVTNGLAVENFDVDEGVYLYGFTVVDYQGNQYYTDFIELTY